MGAFVADITFHAAVSQGMLLVGTAKAAACNSRNGVVTAHESHMTQMRENKINRVKRIRHFRVNFLLNRTKG